MVKKMMALLLAIVLCMGLATVANAEVTTVSDLQTAVNAGGTVKLGADVNLGSTALKFPDNTPVTIDLNGHKLYNSGGFVLVIEAADQVTIADSVGTGSVETKSFYYFQNYGSLTITGGNYTQSGKNLVYTKDRSVTRITNCVMNGKNIIARQSDSSTAFIEGGTFVVNTISTGLWSEGVTITGGTFTLNTTDTPLAVYVDHDDYCITANADGSSSVTQKPPTYTVSVNAGTGGTVSGGGSYEKNTSVTLTAAPNSGYKFVSWTENGGVVSTSASYTFIAEADRELTANFEALPAKAKVTGVAVFLNGQQQPEGEILFGDSDEITIIYQGENFDKLNTNYKYKIGNSSGTIGIYGFFTVNTQTTPHTASKTIKLTSLSKQQTNIIAYTNAGEAQTVTGYTLKYSTPPAEAKITGAVVLLNGIRQAVGEIVFTDGDEITVIYQGENFDQLKNNYQYKIGPASGTIAPYGHFSIDVTSTPHTASRTFTSVTLQAAKQSPITYTKTGESETDTGYTLTYQKTYPVTVTGTDATITYDGSTYDVSSMFTIDPAECDGAKTYTIAGGTGEGSISGSVLTITKAGTFDVRLDVAESEDYAAATDSATLTVNKGEAAIPTNLTAYYGQSLKEVTLPDLWTWQNPDDEVGNADDDNTHQADYAGNDLYAEKKGVELIVTVSQADTRLDVQGESNYYYGENIELTVKVTAVKPAARLFSFRAAPAAGTVSVWNDENMLFEQEADNGDIVNVTIPTLENGLIPGGYTLDVKYTASDNMNAASAEKAITISFLPEAPDPILPEGEWFSTDPTLTAPEGWTISEGIAGPFDGSITPETTDGENVITCYLRNEDGQIAKKTVTVSVDKTAPVIESVTADPTDTTAEITVIARDVPSGIADYELVLSAGEGQPTIVDHGDGTFDVSGLLAGRICTFTLTVTDKAGNTASIPLTVQTQLPPAVVFPKEETEVHVFVGQKAEMKIVAENAYRYEWYRSVDGGETYLRVPGASSPEYAIEYALMKDDGNLYVCRVYGESGVLYADSPVFRLRVEETLPKTGDDTPLALLLGLCLMSLTAMIAFGRRRRMS